MSKTKWEFFKTAIAMFASKGYANVSVRDISSALGRRNSASIYNHFPGKDALLAEAFNFYETNYYATIPTLESLLELVPEHPPQEIWEMIPPIYKPELMDLMTQIVLIAIEERLHDPRANALLNEVFINNPRKYISALLAEMIKHGIIEPIDIKNFAEMYSAYNLYTSARIGSCNSMTFEEWQDGHRFMFSLLRLKSSEI